MQGVNAPLLKGEGNWEKIGLHAGPEARALSCCDALLAHNPFWLKVSITCVHILVTCARGQNSTETWLQKHCAHARSPFANADAEQAS